VSATWTSRHAAKNMAVLGRLQPDTGRRVLIVVCADAAMQMYKAATGAAPTLAEYQHRPRLNIAPAGPQERKLLDWINNSQLFGTDNVPAVSKLIPALAAGTVRHPWQMADRDFIEGNVIFLKGPLANPWASCSSENSTSR
jgi:hypothetical protein